MCRSLTQCGLVGNCLDEGAVGHALAAEHCGRSGDERHCGARADRLVELDRACEVGEHAQRQLVERGCQQADFGADPGTGSASGLRPAISSPNRKSKSTMARPTSGRIRLMTWRVAASWKRVAFSAA